MKILFATDGLSPSLSAGRLLERIADPHRVDVTAFSVFETVVRSTPDWPPIVLENVERRAEWASETAEDAVQTLLRGDFKAETLTANGDPSEEIVRAVEQGGFGLTVMGAGRRGWLGNLLLGSVSLHVLHSSPTSVLIVHETEVRHGPVRILLGADGSTGASLARQTLTDFADPERCEVRVVAVAHEAPVFVQRMPGVIAPPSVSKDLEVTRVLAERVERYAEEAVTHLCADGFRAEGRVKDGHPAGQLLDEAERWNAELVVLGSRGLGSVGRALLGSVSDRIVRRAPATLVGRNSEDARA